MPTIAGQTKKAIRQAVGYNLMGRRFYVGEATDEAPDTSSLIDNRLRGGNDDLNGNYVLFTSGDIAGQQSRVNDYDDTAKDMTLSPALSAVINTGDEYEMWEEEFPPDFVEEAIKQAQQDAKSHVYIEDEEIGYHGDGKTAKFAVPAAMKIIRRIDWRSAVPFTKIHTCEAAFDELVDGDVAVVLDTKDFKHGSQSVKFTLGAGLAAGDIIATDSIDSTNLSGHTYVECWIKSSVATSAGDYQLLLDNTAQCASPLETLNVPALAADAWTYILVALGNPELDTAIISVGLKAVADKGASVIWLDYIMATSPLEAEWTTVHRSGWEIRKEDSLIELKPNAILSVGYSQLRIVGGRSPTVMSDDDDTCEIDDEYVINAATAKVLRNTEDRRGDADRYQVLAEQAKRSFRRVLGRRVD